MCKHSTTSETGLLYEKGEINNGQILQFKVNEGCSQSLMRTYFVHNQSTAQRINQEGSILPPKQKLVVLGAVQRLKPDLPTRAPRPHPPTGVARTTWAPRENISIGMIFNFLSQKIQPSRRFSILFLSKCIHWDDFRSYFSEYLPIQMLLNLRKYTLQDDCQLFYSDLYRAG